MNLMMAAASRVPVAEAAEPNLIANGSFVGHADGWYRNNSDQTTVFDAVNSRSVASGSLSQSRVSGDVSVSYRPGGVPAMPIDGLATVDAVAYVTAPNLTECRMVLDWFSSAVAAISDDYVDQTTVTAVADGSTWVAVIQRDIVVPVGATHVRVNLLGVDGGSGIGGAVLFDDVYLGIPDGDSPPYVGTDDAAFPSNRVINGDFETSADGWAAYWDDEAVTRTEVAPLAGIGSLEVAIALDPENPRGAFYPRGQSIIVVEGEPLRFSFKIKGSGTVSAILDYVGASPVTAWQELLSGLLQVVSVDMTVPAGAENTRINFLVANEAVTFWLDDVSLGTPP